MSGPLFFHAISVLTERLYTPFISDGSGGVLHSRIGGFYTGNLAFLRVVLDGRVPLRVFNEEFLEAALILNLKKSFFLDVNFLNVDT
jgi:hypothetical protein